MAKLTAKDKEILAELIAAQAEREVIPESERIPITNPEKYSFPIGISDAELNEIEKRVKKSAEQNARRPKSL